jgi:hypothetical protein
MEPTPVTKPTSDSETELTRRALDPFFETEEQRDHANQWDVTALLTKLAAEPKKIKPAVDPQ